jgi:hypothetical protein
MKKFLFITILLLAAFSCSDSNELQKKEPWIKVTPTFMHTGVAEPNYEAANGRTQSVCLITKAWTTTSVLDSHPYPIVMTFTTAVSTGPAANLRDGVATYTIRNNNPTSYLTVECVGLSPKGTRSIPPLGTATYQFSIADCNSGVSIVKQYIFTPAGCSDPSFTFWNSGWTNGHTITGTDGCSVATGNVC